MARKKTATGRVRVRALISFNDVRKGDEAELEMTPTLQGFIDRSLFEVLEVLGVGTVGDGPGGLEPGSDDGEQAGVEGVHAEGGEPGEDSDAG